MKQISAIALCLLIVAALVVQPVSAAGVSRERILDLGDGLIAIETLEIDMETRSTEKSATRTWNIQDGTDLIATISIHGVFFYDGSTVRVVSKELSRCDTYGGWSFSQTSFSSSGGTITLTGKLSKFLSSKNISLSLSCDKNGNIF